MFSIGRGGEEVIYFSFSFCSDFNLEATVVKTDKIRGLTLSWRRPLSYRNQSDWFLYDNGPRHERIETIVYPLFSLNWKKKSFSKMINN